MLGELREDQRKVIEAFEADGAQLTGIIAIVFLVLVALLIVGLDAIRLVEFILSKMS